MRRATSTSHLGEAMELWHDFYMTAGGAAAALVGLLFVGVALHLDAVVGRPDVRATARGTFMSLIAILVISLVVLVPQVTPADLGWAVIALGALGLLEAVGDVPRVWGSKGLLGARSAIRKLGLRFAGLLATLAVGILFLNGNRGAPDWLLGVVFLLLASSAQTAWDLLIDVAEAKMTIKKEREAALNEAVVPRPAGR
jgi:hypothetical protein